MGISLPQSGGVHPTVSPQDSTGFANWTGLHWSPLDWQSTSLGEPIFDLAGNLVQVESNWIMWGREKYSGTGISQDGSQFFFFFT